MQWAQSVTTLCCGTLFCKPGHLLFKVSQFGDVHAPIGSTWWLLNWELLCIWFIFQF